jgi:hypothetical protein
MSTMRTIYKTAAGGSLVTVTLLFGVWIAIAAGVTGAIFTTTFDGGFVNANVYESYQDPYLNGGPRPNAPCTAAGLPDGDYYFQVTDPSGSMLLSTDSIDERKVRVAVGIITKYLGTTHETSIGQCRDITVQLYPYSMTPNPGGEYKVWMTPVSSHSPGSGSSGFLPKYSKTDNFKVLSLADTDGDGIPDAEDNCPTVYDPGNACY